MIHTYCEVPFKIGFGWIRANSEHPNKKKICGIFSLYEHFEFASMDSGFGRIR